MAMTRAGWLAALVGALVPASVQAGEPATGDVQVPRVFGRLTANDIGLVINTADPYSVAVGEYYIRARALADEQVLRVELPVHAVLSREEFDHLAARLHEGFAGERVQALALAWRQPYAVGCVSITGAIALGPQAVDCSHTCAPTPWSAYFNSASTRPASDLALRPSMLLAARTVEEARALIDRGVAADRTLGRSGSPPVEALLLRTDDPHRNVRAAAYPASGAIDGLGVAIVNARLDERITQPADVLLLQTGIAKLPSLTALHFVPGALADHLTSAGGRLGEAGGQSDALAWIAAGATASYGTVSEPCNHLQKFPHPQVLLLHYLQGASAIEAYWKSVAWPAQGVFVGEPLAAPFAR